MRIPGMKSLKLSARWLRSRLMGSTLILGYHCIAEPVSDPYFLCVTPEHFREQLEVLRQVGQVISLRELVRGLQGRKVPNRAVVLTFDDGYADVLHQAKPLLDRYQTPATVFVTTGSLGHEFWWDKLERVLLSSARLSERISLQVRDGSYEWVPVDPRHRRAPGSRRDFVNSIYRSLLLLSPGEREKAMDRLWEWIGTAPNDGSLSRRAMAVNELLELAAGDLIDVGAHTVTHPVLAGLPIPVQQSEIQDSKVHLEKILSRPVTSFAYPNGSSSKATLAIVRETGFGCACTSYNDVVWRGSDLFHLPRFWIPDWDGETFSRWLRLWLRA